MIYHISIIAGTLLSFVCLVPFLKPIEYLIDDSEPERGEVEEKEPEIKRTYTYS